VQHLRSRHDVHQLAAQLLRIADAGGCGRYGWYEALDYTRARLPEGAKVVVVRCYMAHHQAMSLVAVANALHDGAMRARFHAEPIVQAAELLLQERMPRDVAVARDCLVYVADYLNGLIHVFDAAGCWRKSFDGAGANNPPLVKPVRVALDREGRIYVVQEGATSVVVLQPDGKFLATIQSPDDLYGRFCPASIAWMRPAICTSPIASSRWCGNSSAARGGGSRARRPVRCDWAT